MRAVLDNRWLSRAGNLVFLLGAGQSIVRWVLGLPLNALGIAFLGLGIALIAAPKLEHLFGRGKTYSSDSVAGRTPVPKAPLEIWLQERLDNADMIQAQRAVRGDDWYFGEMNKWDFANVQRMHDGEDALAPDLVEAYRENPRTMRADGVYPPHDASELDRYYEQRLSWMRDTLHRLQQAAIASQPNRRGATVGALDDRYEAVRDLLGASITVGLRLAEGDGDGPLREAWQHHTSHLIEGAYGLGEAVNVFTPDLSKPRVYRGIEISNAPRPLAEPIERIRQLLGRTHSLTLREGFQPEDWVVFDPESYRSERALEIRRLDNGDRRCPWCGVKLNDGASNCGCGAAISDDWAYKNGSSGASAVASIFRLPPPATQPRAKLADL